MTIGYQEFCLLNYSDRSAVVARIMNFHMQIALTQEMQGNPLSSPQKSKLQYPTKTQNRLQHTVLVIPSVNLTRVMPLPPLAGSHWGSKVYTSCFAESSEFAGL